jgi:hypothetical protein
MNLRLSVKVGDIVKRKRDYRHDHAFQRMPVGYIISENGCKSITKFEVRWFKHGDKFWKAWWNPDELLVITKPLKKYQQADVLP